MERKKRHDPATADAAAPRRWVMIRKLARRYFWIHAIIGIVGHSLFVGGSVLFLWDARQPAIWLFICGSTGMLVGTVGSVLARLETSWLDRHAPAGGEGGDR